MSALNLKNVKRDFSQLNYRPDMCHPSLINELKNILEATGLRQEYDTAIVNLNSHLLIDIIQHVCKICYSDSCKKEMVVNFLTFLSKVYTEHCIDDAVKNTVTKCLKTCPLIFQSELSIAISCQFISKMENKQNLSETEYFLKTLNECCEKFPSFISNCIDKVVEFFEVNLRRSYEILVNYREKCVTVYVQFAMLYVCKRQQMPVWRPLNCESCPTQKISAIRCIHESFRFFLTAYKKNVFPETLHFSLNICFMDLLDSDNLPMETLFNCCLSIVYSYSKDKTTLECWKMCLDKLSTRSDLIKLGFCVAILNAFTTEELIMIEPNSGKSIFANLYNIIMEASIRNLNDSSILISSSRVLVVFSKRLCTKSKIDIEKDQIERLINFLWVRLDHFIDGVRHSARDAMINVIKMKDEFILDIVLNRLSTCDKNSKAFFTVLSIISDKVDSRSIIKYLPNISETLIHLMASNNSTITVYINLMLNHYTIIGSKLWFDYWLHPLFNKTDKLDIKHFEQIITKAVEVTPDVSKHIHDLSNQNELSLKIYLICFNIEKKMYLKYNDDQNWMSQTNIETIKRALHNKDDNIRFIAINLILECQKKTQPFTDEELELVKYFIMYNIKTEKPSIRQTNLSFVKKTLMRMNESQLSVTVRNDESLNSKLLKYYTEFQHWFSNFCFQNLFSDANFFRRNFSLQSLRLIQTYLGPTGIIGLNESNNFSLVLNCIWDTYEQNKVLARDILTCINQELIKLDNIIIEDMLKTSKILASSTSPPDSITAGYLLEVFMFLKYNTNHEEYTYNIILDLLDDLKKEVELAEENLTLASGKGPMYGLIHTIQHLLNTINWQNHSLKDSWTTFIENLSKTCLKCEKLVSIVVNDSSPEGIIPMDDLYQNDCQVTSQMILLCCWRTAKESSLLLADIVSIIETQDTDFSNALITQICLCLTLLLSETKHRGAFEQIYVAYSKVCSIMWKSPTLYKIPLRYLEDVLTEIKTGLGDSFCVTRRSAGMPFIIQALVCTNHDKRKNVNHTMETLISICENKNTNEDLKVGVVHALNVLRALFRCSQLGDLVGPFVSRAINISIVLFNSSSWPIRNSSTLLLSALINRVFGVPRSSTEISWKNRMTGREFFQRYPELYNTFLNEFKKFSPMDMRPSLYPTLLILTRLYPTLNEATDCIFQLSIYVPYIFKCAQSPVMKTRMLAATSIAPQITQNKLVEHLYITYNELIAKCLKENTTHGLLLQMFSLVKNLPKLDDFDKLVLLTEDLIRNYSRFINCSYIIQEVFLRCIMCLWLQLDDVQYNESVKQFCTLTLESIAKLVQTNPIGRSKYLESATLLLFVISLKAQTDFSIVVYNIMNNNVHCETVFKILGFILSEKPLVFCDDLDNFKNLYWDRKVLTDQLMANKSLTELVCQQCTIVDSSIDMKYLVLSKFTPVLHMYFKTYDSIDNFISKLFNVKRDSEIAQALSCINGYLYSQTSLDQSVIEQLTHLFDNIYYDQRSDECKNVCIDIIVDHYNLLIRSNSINMIVFLKLWNIIIHYSEDNSEEVRNHVWRLVNKETNCAKSFELLFDKFAEHFEQYPAAVLIALIYWSYLDVELHQDRPEGQVFDGGDTSEFKEHTIRKGLALNIIIYLTNNNPQAINLEINKYLQEWIIEEWTTDSDNKPTILNLKSVGDFMTYAKNVYSITSKLMCLKLTN